MQLFKKQCIKYVKQNCLFQKKIVLFRMDAIGDFVLWMDAAKEFKVRFYNRKIILVTTPILKDIAISTGFFDEVVGVDLKKMKKSFFYLLYIRFYFLKYSFATVIQTVYSRTIETDTLVKFIPGKAKITINGERKLPKEDRTYKKIINTGNDVEMELIRNAVFMRKLGFPNFRANIPVVTLKVANNSILPRDKYYVMVLETSSEKKNWDLNHFTEVANYINKVSGYKCCLLGSPSEIESGKKFLAQVTEGNVINYIGKTTITEYFNMIANSEFVISGDTSSIHIAASAGIRSICIGGGWHYQRFLPYKTEVSGSKQFEPILCNVYMDCYGCGTDIRNRDCIKSLKKTGRWACVEAVSVESVLEAFEQMWNMQSSYKNNDGGDHAECRKE